MSININHSNNTIAPTSDGISITGNSTSPALKITQTSTGNALLVEDSTSPDSTPFVIDASGNVMSGFTTAKSTVIGGVSYTPLVQLGGDTASTSMLGIFSAGNNPTLVLTKSNGTLEAPTAVTTNNGIGRISSSAYDGSAYIEAGRIVCEVDATVSTGIIPTRYLFATTNTAGALTTAMRIDSAQQIAVGSAAPSTGRSFTVSKNITGATTAYGMASTGVVQSDVTATAGCYLATANTQATTFTLSDLRYFAANQGTFGAGSTVTIQTGFLAGSSLIGATSNFGFRGDIPAGTGRWNFYGAGTARNYFAGGLEVVAGATGMTSGFTHVPAAAGTPTGAPTNPTGNVPLYYDTTNNKLYAYNGAWVSVTLA